ncbi:hypothetical protein [Ferroacidibacillus organovorans]|uniref:Uncharacterized protein n=1 Tax=Ferroacidibacillus organovorans TaxID=1765683 RepID=A0A853K8W6_9BACL|nr:hypothetical protein [Ferroacidibacillus organovorans]KYP79550.1 hypothetical protein AYJ22_14340 [Ferroacidibacillus organovorans]OAG91384.1 hypothetical protein AYW79_13720 [Ferroacidibacillus organovorans]
MEPTNFRTVIDKCISIPYGQEIIRVLPVARSIFADGTMDIENYAVTLFIRSGETKILEECSALDDANVAARRFSEADRY